MPRVVTVAQARFVLRTAPSAIALPRHLVHERLVAPSLTLLEVAHFLWSAATGRRFHVESGQEPVDLSQVSRLSAFKTVVPLKTQQRKAVTSPSTPKAQLPSSRFGLFRQSGATSEDQRPGPSQNSST